MSTSGGFVTPAPAAWADLPNLGANVSHGVPHAQYRVDNQGQVQLKGQLVFAGAVGTLATLPAGARPPAAVVMTHRVLVVGAAQVTIAVDTAGNITTSNAGQATQTQNLDGLQFSTT